jgi:hypothetical protein
MQLNRKDDYQVLTMRDFIKLRLLLKLMIKTKIGWVKDHKKVILISAFIYNEIKDS